MTGIYSATVKAPATCAQWFTVGFSLMMYFSLPWLLVWFSILLAKTDWSKYLVTISCLQTRKSEKSIKVKMELPGYSYLPLLTESLLDFDPQFMYLAISKIYHRNRNRMFVFVKTFNKAGALSKMDVCAK